MIRAGSLLNGLLLLAAAGALAACSMDVPDFVGRDGGGDGFYRLGGETPPPPPRPVALREATAERALHGVILRVVGETPTQGFFSATLVPLNGGAPDKAGILAFQFVASPPATPHTVGPPRTRIVSAGVFMPTASLKNLRGFRVDGMGSQQTVMLR